LVPQLLHAISFTTYIPVFMGRFSSLPYVTLTLLLGHFSKKGDTKNSTGGVETSGPKR
jgi:hypothetical protein